MDHAVVLAAVAQDGEAFRLAPEPCSALVVLFGHQRAPVMNPRTA